MTSKTKEVALFGNKEAQLPAYAAAAGGALGNEELGTDDLAIPRLSLLQGLSPQVTNGNIDGAKPGLFHLSVTDDLFESAYVMNLAFAKNYTVFTKRSEGGGFHGGFDTEAEAREHIATLPGDGSKYEVTETHIHTLLILDGEGKPTGAARMFMQSTKIAPSKQWNSQIRLLNPDAPRFASVWELTAVKQTNARGTFYNIGAEFAGWASEELFEEAKRTYYRVTGRTEPEAASAEEAAA